MTSIGSLVFCSDCGNLLDENENREEALLKCDICGAMCKDTSQKVIKTVSKPWAYPSSLRAKRSEVQQISEESRNTQATIEVKCEKCGAPEVTWYEQQLRGADEGSTIFYKCPNCQHLYVFVFTVRVSRKANKVAGGHKTIEHVYYSLIPLIPLSCNECAMRSLWNQGIMSLATLLVLGHIQCDHHTFTNHLFRII